MKQTTILWGGVVVAAGLLSMQHRAISHTEWAKFKESHRNTSGSPAARTGAPGELNCTSCHAGSATTNSPKNSLTFRDSDGTVVSSYLPDSTYTVTLLVNDPAPKKGFQLVALAAVGNTQAGVMTGSSQGGTNRITSGGKQYINHTTASTGFTNGWTFTWKAPTASVGDVKFYIASNITNSSNSDSGDQIHLTQVTIQKDATAALIENEASFGVWKNKANQLVVTSPEMDNISWISVVTLDGKELVSMPATKNVYGLMEVPLPADLDDQLVIVRVRTAKQWLSKKMML